MSRVAGIKRLEIKRPSVARIPVASGTQIVMIEGDEGCIHWLDLPGCKPTIQNVAASTSDLLRSTRAINEQLQFGLH